MREEDNITPEKLLKLSQSMFKRAAEGLLPVLDPANQKKLQEEILPDIRLLFPVRFPDEEMKRLMLAFNDTGEPQFASDEDLVGKVLIPVVTPNETGAYLYLLGLLDGSIPRDPISEEAGFPEIPEEIKPMENESQ